MLTSKLTIKFQATVPREIREMLELNAGDSITFEIDENKAVILKKLKPIDREHLENLNQTLTEWSSPYDDEAFEHLQNV